MEGRPIPWPQGANAEIGLFSRSQLSRARGDAKPPLATARTGADARCPSAGPRCKARRRHASWRLREGFASLSGSPAPGTRGNPPGMRFPRPAKRLRPGTIGVRSDRLLLWASCRLQKAGVNFHEFLISRRFLQVLVHQFFCMATDTQRFVILSPVIIFLGVHMVRMQVFAVNGVTEINPTFFVLADPAISRSMARTDFAKTNAIMVQWRGIVRMRWQRSKKSVWFIAKIFIERKGSVYFSDNAANCLPSPSNEVLS